MIYSSPFFHTLFISCFLYLSCFLFIPSPYVVCCLLIIVALVKLGQSMRHWCRRDSDADRILCLSLSLSLSHARARTRTHTHTHTHAHTHTYSFSLCHLQSLGPWALDEGTPSATLQHLSAQHLTHSQPLALFYCFQLFFFYLLLIQWTQNSILVASVPVIMTYQEIIGNFKVAIFSLKSHGN